MFNVFDVSEMGKDYEMVRKTITVKEDDLNKMSIKIVDEKNPVTESPGISCTCDNDHYCQDCEEKHTMTISDGKAVLRKRFKSDDNIEELKTSSYDVDTGGWIERDPETTQTFKRKEQVSK